MTHRYTLLIRGTVISGRDEPDVSAIAWAADTVIALGSDDDVRGTSRGDSHVIDLGGASVVALGEGPDARWPPDATLEVGGRADWPCWRATRVGSTLPPGICRSSPSSAADASSPEGCQGRPRARHELDPGRILTPDPGRDRGSCQGSGRGSSKSRRSTDKMGD